MSRTTLAIIWYPTLPQFTPNVGFLLSLKTAPALPSNQGSIALVSDEIGRNHDKSKLLGPYVAAGTEEIDAESDQKMTELVRPCPRLDTNRFEMSVRGYKRIYPLTDISNVYYLLSVSC